MNCFANKQAISFLYSIISDISCPFWLLAHFPWRVQSLHIKLKESYSFILVCPLSPFLGWELLVNTVPSGCNFLLHICWNHVRDCSWWAFQEPATTELVSLPARHSLQLLAILFLLHFRIVFFSPPGIWMLIWVTESLKVGGTSSSALAQKRGQEERALSTTGAS